MSDNNQNINVNVEGLIDPSLKQIDQSINSFAKSLEKLNTQLDTYNKNTKAMSKLNKSLKNMDTGKVLNNLFRLADEAKAGEGLINARRTNNRQTISNTFGRSYANQMQQQLEDQIIKSLKASKPLSKNATFQRGLQAFYDAGMSPRLINSAFNNVLGKSGTTNSGISSNRDIVREISQMKTVWANNLKEQKIQNQQQNKLAQQDQQRKERKSVAYRKQIINDRVERKKFNDDVNNQVKLQAGTQTQRIRQRVRNEQDDTLNNNPNLKNYVYRSEQINANKRLATSISQTQKYNDAKDMAFLLTAANSAKKVGNSYKMSDLDKMTERSAAIDRQKSAIGTRLSTDWTLSRNQKEELNLRVGQLIEEKKALNSYINQVNKLTATSGSLDSELKRTKDAQANQNRQVKQSKSAQQQYQDSQNTDVRGSAFLRRFSYVSDYMVQGGIMGGIATSLNFLKEFEAALKQTQAIADATDEQMEGLKKSIIAVSDASRFSAIELTDAATTLAQAGFNVSDIQGTLASVATLATATGSSLSESVDLATSVLSAFKMSVESMPSIVNQITQAMNLSKLDINKFMLTTQYAANAAADLGISFKEMLSATAAVSNTGIRSGSTMGTGMRQLLADLASPTDKLKEKLTQLGLTLSDIDVRSNGLTGVMKKLQKAGFTTADAFDSFELRATAYYVALNNNMGAYDDLYDSMNNTTAAQKAQDTQMNSLAAQTDRLTNQLKLLVETLGGDLRQSLTAIAKGLADVLGWFNNTFSDSVLSKIVSFTVAVASLFGAFKVISGVLRVLGGAGKILLGATSGLTGTAAAMAGLFKIASRLNIVLAVASVAVVALTKIFNAHQDSVEKANAVLDKAQTKWNTTKEAVSSTTQAIAEINTHIESTNARMTLLSEDSSELENAFSDLQQKATELGVSLETNLGGSVENLRKGWLELRLEMQKTLDTQLTSQKIAADQLAQASLGKYSAERGAVEDNIRKSLGWGWMQDPYRRTGAHKTFVNPDNINEVIDAGVGANGRIQSQVYNPNTQRPTLGKLSYGQEDSAIIAMMTRLGMSKQFGFSATQQNQVSAMGNTFSKLTANDNFINSAMTDSAKTDSALKELNNAVQMKEAIENKYLTFMQDRLSKATKGTIQYTQIEADINTAKANLSAFDNLVGNARDALINNQNSLRAGNQIGRNKGSISVTEDLRNGKFDGSSGLNVGNTGVSYFDTSIENAKKIPNGGNVNNPADAAKIVYNAAIENGLNDAQARALVYSMARENDFNPKAMFGSHIDKAKGTNFGAYSWQISKNNDRGIKAKNYLSSKGLIKADGTIEATQKGLEGQVEYAVKEILSNPKLADQFSKVKTAQDAVNVDKAWLKSAVGQTTVYDQKTGKRVPFNSNNHVQRGLNGISLLGNASKPVLTDKERVREQTLDEFKLDTKQEQRLKLLTNQQLNLTAERKKLLDAQEKLSDAEKKSDANQENLGRISSLSEELSNVEKAKSEIKKTLTEQYTGENDRKKALLTIDLKISKSSITDMENEIANLQNMANPDYDLIKTKTNALYDAKDEYTNKSGELEKINKSKINGNQVKLDNLDAKSIDIDTNEELKKNAQDRSEALKKIDNSLTENALKNIDTIADNRKKAFDAQMTQIDKAYDNYMKLYDIEHPSENMTGFRVSTALTDQISRMDNPLYSKDYTSMQKALYDKRLSDVNAQYALVNNKTKAERDVSDNTKQVESLQAKIAATTSERDSLIKDIEELKKITPNTPELQRKQADTLTEKNTQLSEKDSSLKDMSTDAIVLNTNLEKAKFVLDTINTGNPEQMSMLEQLNQTYANELETLTSAGAVGDRIKETLDSLKDGFIGVADTLMDTTDNIDDFFNAIFTGSNGAKDAMKAMLRDIVKQMARTMMNKWITQFMDLMSGKFSAYMSTGQGENGQLTGTQQAVGFLGQIASAMFGAKISGAGAGNYAAAQNTYTQTVQYKKMGGMIRRSSGGSVPTTNTSNPNRDSVPVLAMPDEYMLKQNTSNLLGTDFLNSLNNKPMETLNKITAQPKMSVDNYQETAVYVVTPDQKPANISPNQIIAVVSEHMDRGGSLNQKIKTVVNRG